MSKPLQPRVAIVGAGLAGATCAHALRQAGAHVHVFDKARGPGGRLATRRLEIAGADGLPRTVRLDHGAPGFAVTDEAFAGFLRSALPQDALTPWRPVLAPGSRAVEPGPTLWLPQPDMPSLCRHLLSGVDMSWSCAIERLARDGDGWQLVAAGEALPGRFDTVLLALPPAQAAPLLAPLRPDWAQQAAAVAMQPCWTLMGVTASPTADPAWDAARPVDGPLAWVLRPDRRPGREPVPCEAHWVLHARDAFTAEHLEQEPAAVLPLLQAALHACLGETLTWRHAVAHRWRYALPPGRPGAATAWWDASAGLGVCGDFLGGPADRAAQGAWQSAQALMAAIRPEG
jgi:hypothetical protein